jgi:hypothetical protein
MKNIIKYGIVGLFLAVMLTFAIAETTKQDISISGTATMDKDIYDKVALSKDSKGIETDILTKGAAQIEKEELTKANMGLLQAYAKIRSSNNIKLIEQATADLTHLYDEAKPTELVVTP